MGNENTSRVEHPVTKLPNTFRDKDAQQILDDIDEAMTGKGYLEVIRDDVNSVFITKITKWNAPTKNFKRCETLITRDVPPFISQIVQNIYSEDGSAIVATVTSNITRTGNKLSAYVDTSIVRI